MQKSESIAAQYVYCHFNNEHGVFYVGKGSGKRMFVTGRHLGLFRENIRKVLAGKYAHTGGFSFKYMDGEI